MGFILNIKYYWAMCGIKATHFFNPHETREKELAKLETDYAMCKLFKEMQANQEYYAANNDANNFAGVFISDETFTKFTKSISAELAFEELHEEDLFHITRQKLQHFVRGNLGRYLGMGVFNGPSKTSAKDHQMLSAIRDLIYFAMPIQLATEMVKNSVEQGYNEEVISSILLYNQEIYETFQSNEEGQFFPGEKKARRMPTATSGIAIEKRMRSSLLKCYEDFLKESINKANAVGPIDDSEGMTALKEQIETLEKTIITTQENLDQSHQKINNLQCNLNEENEGFFKELKNHFPINCPSELGNCSDFLDNKRREINDELSKLTSLPPLQNQTLEQTKKEEEEKLRLKIELTNHLIKRFIIINNINISYISNLFEFESNEALFNKKIHEMHDGKTELLVAYNEAELMNMRKHQKEKAEEVKPYEELLSFLQTGKPPENFYRQPLQTLSQRATNPHESQGRLSRSASF